MILWTLVWGFLGYAWFLPVLSLSYGSGIYWYVIVYLGVSAAISSVADGDIPIPGVIAFIGALITLIVWLCIVIFGTWGLINTQEYRTLIGEVTEEAFVANVAPVSPEQMLTVDRGIAYRIGSKVLGEDPGLGSRCQLGGFYLQEVGGHLYWIAPLVHSGFWKWQGNNGTPGYVVVNATNERDYRLVKEVNGKPITIRYQPNAFWGDNLERHLYTSGFSGVGLTDYTFEVNEDWEPYWTVTTYDSKVGFMGDEATGVAVVDPASGEIHHYAVSDVPEWSDRIHPEGFVREQVYDWGDLVNGYFNWAGTDKLHPAAESSVVLGSDGDMYYYLGLQSKGSDQGTTGFLMINCRTKKTTWIRQAGATEEAARASAEGMVQEKGYVGSDGITYNINGHATYEFLLKDNAGLMKMIALVNVHDHNIVGVASDRLGAMRNYAVKMNGRGNASVGHTTDLEVVESVSKIIRFNSEVNTGNTIYYFMVEGLNTQFFGTSSISTEFCLSRPGDVVAFSFIQTENDADIEVGRFDNRSINLARNPVEAVNLAQNDSVRDVRLNRQREDVLDRTWETMSPEEKKQLLEKK
jgi:hypothetical protein